jgi:hypothetical protein
MWILTLYLHYESAVYSLCMSRYAWIEPSKFKRFHLCCLQTYVYDIRIYVYVCIYVCIHVYIYICTYVCMYICTYVCMNICMYICTYVYMYVRMYICMYECMYIWIMYVCVSVCMYVCIYESCINIYIHVYQIFNYSTSIFITWFSCPEIHSIFQTNFTEFKPMLPLSSYRVSSFLYSIAVAAYVFFLVFQYPLPFLQ